jgi:hypothetical protein
MGIIKISRVQAIKVLRLAKRYQNNRYLELPKENESVLLHTGAKLYARKVSNKHYNYYIGYYAMDKCDLLEILKCI